MPFVKGATRIEDGLSKMTVFDTSHGFDRSCPDCGAKKQRPNFKCCEEADREAGKVMDKASNDRTFDKAWNVLKAKMCEECGFPIDPTNAVYPPGSECICDLKGAGN